MLETCRGGPGPISLSDEDTKNFDQVRQPRSYMLETCRARGGPGPISLSVEKTKNFDQVHLPRSWRPKWTKFLIGLLSPYLMPLE